MALRRWAAAARNSGSGGELVSEDILVDVVGSQALLEFSRDLYFIFTHTLIVFGSDHLRIWSVQD